MESQSVVLISNKLLSPGMITWKQVNGGFKPDVKLRKPFLTSPRFPAIAFEADHHIVVYSPCGKTYVTSG